MPGIWQTVRVFEEPAVVQHGEDLFETRVTVVDSTSVDIFTLPLARGSSESALNRRECTVLRTDAARRYFGSAERVRAVGVRKTGGSSGTTHGAVLERGVPSLRSRVTMIRPEEIDYVDGAGDNVELHARDNTHL